MLLKKILRASEFSKMLFILALPKKFPSVSKHNKKGGEEFYNKESGVLLMQWFLTLLGHRAFSI